MTSFDRVSSLKIGSHHYLPTLKQNHCFAWRASAGSSRRLAPRRPCHRYACRRGVRGRKQEPVGRRHASCSGTLLQARRPFFITCTGPGSDDRRRLEAGFEGRQDQPLLPVRHHQSGLPTHSPSSRLACRACAPRRQPPLEAGPAERCRDSVANGPGPQAGKARRAGYRRLRHRKHFRPERYFTDAGKKVSSFGLYPRLCGGTGVEMPRPH